MEETSDSTSKPAGESRLNELHEKVAQAYLGILNATPCSECGQCLPTAADLKAAAIFLKDNKITCDRSEGRMEDLHDASMKLLEIPIDSSDITATIGRTG